MIQNCIASSSPDSFELIEKFNNCRPEVFSLETTLACNLKCPECALGGGMIDRSKGFMNFDTFKIVADKIRPYVKYFYLHIWGEPMLNKDIITMIKYASTFTKTNISTNGIVLDENKAEELITSGVSDIIVSIDGVSQEIYEKYRIGGNVQQAWQALYWLQQDNIKHGSRVNIFPQFIVFKHNQHEMQHFHNLCLSIGLQPTFKSPYIRTDKSDFEYSELPQFIRPHFPDHISLRNAMIECANALNVFTILFDGSVVICCHDYGGLTTFGNIFEQEVSDIWDDPSYRKFRWQIISGNAPEFCINNCMTYFLEKRSHNQKTSLKQSDKYTSSFINRSEEPKKINLCCGPIKLDGFINIDISTTADIVIDLEKELLPFPDESIDTVVCISAINYFTRQRALEIIKDVYRVLKTGGVVRFGVQDLRTLAEKYLHRDYDFYFQKLPDGRDRFPGATFADKFNEFFYGFNSGGKNCKYVHDYESLGFLFKEAGFLSIEQKKYQDSKIPQIEKIDNRPEQMFFLETVKEDNRHFVHSDELKNTLQKIRQSIIDKQEKENFHDPDALREKAFLLFQSGEKDRAWNYLLKTLELKPDDLEAVKKCGEILDEHNRLEDAVKLYQSYLDIHPFEYEIKSALLNTIGKIRKRVPDNRIYLSRRKELDDYNFRFNTVHSDEEHLSACITWLQHAQNINTGGGVSAMYHIDTQSWDADYPETTGYIIPTFLCYHHYTGDNAYKESAIAMGDWEISIQDIDGGVGEPAGVYGLRPRVFNTAQVILGWLSLYKYTENNKYLEAASKAGDWILSKQDSDGKWTKSTYNGPKAYKSRVSWALLELYAVTNEKKYRDAAKTSLDWILSQAQENGWFDNNSLTEPGKPWTHLIGYVLGGLLEIYRLENLNIDYEKTISLLHNAAKGIIEYYFRRNEQVSDKQLLILPGTFDNNWFSKDSWSCITGNAQLEFFFRRLHGYTADPLLIEAADLILINTKKLHFMDEIDDPNLYGGLCGSYPIAGDYCGYAIPNWGVKFFADCLLQRISAKTDMPLPYIG